MREASGSDTYTPTLTSRGWLSNPPRDRTETTIIQNLDGNDKAVIIQNAVHNFVVAATIVDLTTIKSTNATGQLQNPFITSGSAVKSLDFISHVQFISGGLSSPASNGPDPLPTQDIKTPLISIQPDQEFIEEFVLDITNNDQSQIDWSISLPEETASVQRLYFEKDTGVYKGGDLVLEGAQGRHWRLDIEKVTEQSLSTQNVMKSILKDSSEYLLMGSADTDNVVIVDDDYHNIVQSVLTAREGVTNIRGGHDVVEMTLKDGIKLQLFSKHGEANSQEFG